MSRTGTPACARWTRRRVDWDAGSPIDVLREWQRDQCALCGANLLRTRDVLDHSHKTGLVRGQLCNTCNCHFADHNRAYVEGCNPAALLGVVDIYRNVMHFPVMRGDAPTVYACFTLAGLAFDALPHWERTDYTDAELTAARDHLWALEGWPVPQEWRWQKPAAVGRRWTPPPPAEPDPNFWADILARLNIAPQPEGARPAS